MWFNEILVQTRTITSHIIIENVFAIFLGQVTSISDKCHRKSSGRDSARDNVITVEPVKSEPEINDNTIQRELSRIMHAIASLGDRHMAACETINKKLDVLATKQENMNDKLNVIATAVGIAFIPQGGTEAIDK